MIFETLERLRKSPSKVRQQFVSFVAVVAMAAVAFVWLIFFLWNMSHMQFSLPASATQAELRAPYEE